MDVEKGEELEKALKSKKEHHICGVACGMLFPAGWERGDEGADEARGNDKGYGRKWCLEI